MNRVEAERRRVLCAAEALGVAERRRVGSAEREQREEARGVVERWRVGGAERENRERRGARRGGEAAIGRRGAEADGVWGDWGLQGRSTFLVEMQASPPLPVHLY
jgi:hypothetical protein